MPLPRPHWGCGDRPQPPFIPERQPRNNGRQPSLARPPQSIRAFHADFERTKGGDSIWDVHLSWWVPPLPPLKSIWLVLDHNSWSHPLRSHFMLRRHTQTLPNYNLGHQTLARAKLSVGQSRKEGITVVIQLDGYSWRSVGSAQRVRTFPSPRSDRQATRYLAVMLCFVRECSLHMVSKMEMVTLSPSGESMRPSKYPWVVWVGDKEELIRDKLERSMSWYVVMRNVFQFYCLTVLPGFATVLVDKLWQLFSVLLLAMKTADQWV